MFRYFSNIIKIIALICLSMSAHAWEPTKPINVLVGFAPGSGNEISFRGVGSILEKSNPKINFIIENKPGADGVVAMNEFIKKPADGHNIYVPSHQGIWVTAEFFNKPAVKYTLDDFEYVVTIAKSPLALIAYSGSTVNTVPELLERIKNTDKPITFAAGSGAHKLAFEYMANKVKVSELVKTVGYKGPAQAAQDVAGGHVEFGIIPTAVAATLLSSGKIKFIGICGEKPIIGIDAPLMNRWVPGMNVYAAWGIILPKGTDQDIVKWYVENFSRTIRSTEAKKFFDQNYMFMEERELTPIGFKNSMLQLREQWVPILQNFKVE